MGTGGLGPSGVQPISWGGVDLALSNLGQCLLSLLLFCFFICEIRD